MKELTNRKQSILSLAGATLSLAICATPAFSEETKKPVDPASSRIIYGPTALPNEKTGVKLTSFDIGFWQLDYAPNSSFNVGLQTIPPLGAYVIGGTFRGTYTLASEVNVGVYGNIGTMGIFTHDSPVAYYGGGPMLTLGNSRRALTFSVLSYGASHEDSSGFVMLPGMGGSIQVSDRVKLNLEGYAITSPTQHKVVRAGAVLYGVRIFSETGSVFGDISFLAPIYSGAGDFYRYIPMGIPIIAFGFSI